MVPTTVAATTNQLTDPRMLATKCARARGVTGEEGMERDRRKIRRVRGITASIEIADAAVDG